MGKIEFIRKSEVDQSLLYTTRQYFVGDLQRPQILQFIKSSDLEVGITSYRDYSLEPPHRHSVATEYQYVVSGCTQYMDVESKEVFQFSQGDFYVIHSGTAYAQRSAPDTRILFIKVPSTNDKEIVAIEKDVQEWLATKLSRADKEPTIGISDDRLKHSIGVARKLYSMAIQRGWSQQRAEEAFVMGLLHDVGYEFVDYQPNHAYYGGNILNRCGYKFANEIARHGKNQTDYRSEELEMLNTADFLVSAKGEEVTAEERLRDIALRYGADSTQYKEAVILAKSLRLIEC